MSGLVRSCIAGGAIHAFVAIAAGAFASHGVDPDSRAHELLQIAARYQLAHGIALVLLFGLPFGLAARSRVAILMHVGIILFAGSLYAMAMGAPRILGAVTPIGGTGFLVAWASVAVLALRSHGGRGASAGEAQRNGTRSKSSDV